MEGGYSKTREPWFRYLSEVFDEFNPDDAVWHSLQEKSCQQEFVSGSECIKRKTKCAKPHRDYGKSLRREHFVNAWHQQHEDSLASCHEQKRNADSVNGPTPFAVKVSEIGTVCDCASEHEERADQQMNIFLISKKFFRGIFSASVIIFVMRRFFHAQHNDGCNSECHCIYVENGFQSVCFRITACDINRCRKSDCTKRSHFGKVISVCNYKWIAQSVHRPLECIHGGINCYICKEYFCA